MNSMPIYPNEHCEVTRGFGCSATSNIIKTIQCCSKLIEQAFKVACQTSTKCFHRPQDYSEETIG